MDGTQLKPSEALRKGVAMVGKRCTNEYVRRNKAGEIIACCGQGAVLLGAGIDPTLILSGIVDSTAISPFAGWRVADPEDETQTTSIKWALVYLNDKLNWSFNKQAAYLEKHGL